MSYVPDANVQDVRTQETSIPAAQEGASHQERALERHRAICRRIDVSFAAKCLEHMHSQKYNSWC